MLAAKLASAAFGSPLLGRWGTNSHMSSQVYAPTSNSPEALESSRANTKEKHSTQNDFFPRGKTKQKQLFLIAAKRAYELSCGIFLHAILQIQSGCHYQKRFLWTDNQNSTIYYIASKRFPSLRKKPPVFNFAEGKKTTHTSLFYSQVL